MSNEYLFWYEVAVIATVVKWLPWLGAAVVAFLAYKFGKRAAK